MTLKECYERLGGDYADVASRLPSEKFILKFVLKFLDDGSYAMLLNALETGNGEEAFRAAHTIKGMCANLGFTKLGESSSALTEFLRPGLSGDYSALLEQVCRDYEQTCQAIRAMQESQE